MQMRSACSVPRLVGLWRPTYFWIEAKINVAANKVTGVVHKLEFNREPNASLRVGRDALMNVPQIADIRSKLAAQTS